MTDDFGIADGIEGVFENVCIFEGTVALNASQEDMIQDNSTGEWLPKDILEIIEKTCPNNCNDNGTCDDGVCICDEG